MINALAQQGRSNPIHITTLTAKVQIAFFTSRWHTAERRYRGRYFSYEK
jgi:hypothetical protein